MTNVRTALRISVALALVIAAREARSEGARVRVRGTSHIDARVARADGKLVLSGTLVDDAARAIAGERVAVRLSSGDRAITFDATSFGACADNDARAAQAAPTLVRAEELAMRSDEVGRFCVRLTLPATSYVAHLEFGGAGNVDGSRADVPLDFARRPLALAFDPEPRSIDLDEPLQPVEVVATIEENGASAPGTGLLLLLTNESGQTVASGTTNASGRVRLALDAKAIGAPGRGELRVVFTGSADTSSASHAAPIERRTHVVLAAPEANEGKLAPGVPEDGVAVTIEARARALANGPTPITPSGSVEARVGDTIVGAAPLEGGKARVVVTFAAPAWSSGSSGRNSNETPIRFRYAPDAPWFVRGDDLPLVLPVRGPSPWRHGPLAIAGVAVVLWLAVGRARRPDAKREKTAGGRDRAVRAEPKVEVVRASEEASGWSGYVIDAHDDCGVSAARVSIERAGFERVEVIATALTNERGWFELAHVPLSPGDVLSAEGPLHAAHRQPVPPSGELAIALVQRKRALLDRLVAWARTRGKPFDAAPEPTPGHVRRAAAGEFGVARWADAVERAAYSGAVVDARAEADVDRLAPAAAAQDAARAALTVKDAPRAELEEGTAQGFDPSS